MEKNCIVLCSGGIDSTTTMAIARKRGFSIYAISFNYSQRHVCEIDSAKKVTKFFNVKKHLIVDIDLSQIGGSALTDNIEVPQNRKFNEISQNIPVTYVPARNTIFLSIALSWAESLRIFDIFIGATAIDYSGYPDCRPEYLKAFESLANLATKAAIEKKGIFKIHAPLLYMTKAQIIKKGMELGIDYSITHSCYNPQKGLACGSCDACILRKKGFKESEIEDLTNYIKEDK